MRDIYHSLEHVNWKMQPGRNELQVNLGSLFSRWKRCEKNKNKIPTVPQILTMNI